MKKLAAISISALMIALLVGLVAAPASAQSVPPKKPTCQVSDTSLSPGDQVTVSGKHWKAGSTVTFTLEPEGINLGSATVGTNHKFSAVVTIPQNIGPGAHTIVCSGISVKGTEVAAETTIQVLGGAVAAGGTAFTGSNANVPLWIVLILGLFVAGVLLVMLARRRKRSVGTGS
jgi:endo-alpha-N-acetylgalactosaminidase